MTYAHLWNNREGECRICGVASSESPGECVARTEKAVLDMPDIELLRRAVGLARAHRSRWKQPRWVAVMDCFCLGSTYAWQLCERFGFDPDEKVRR